MEYKLTSTTEQILGEANYMVNDSIIVNEYMRLVGYAKFLKLDLKLGMFIPTYKEENVLKEPKEYNFYLDSIACGNMNDKELKDWKYYLICKQYQEAKERVLFEGDWNKNIFIKNCVGIPNIVIIEHINKRKIEDLTEYGLVLTKTAIKIINNG